VKLHVFGAGNFQSLPEKANDRKSHDAVLFLKARVSDDGLAASRQLDVDRDSLKISGMDSAILLITNSGETQFHERFVDAAKLPLDDRFLKPR